MITRKNYQYCADLSVAEMLSMRSKRFNFQMDTGEMVQAYIAEVDPGKGLTVLAYKDKVCKYRTIKAGDELTCIHFGRGRIHNIFTMQAYLKAIKWFGEVTNHLDRDYSDTGTYFVGNSAPLSGNMATCAFL